jgi:catechol 2,3-dioxygenase-like lactoylglutathione lyase family enzyme
VPILRLNHGSVTVADLDRSIGFWRDVIGLELLGSGEVAFPHLDEIIGLGPTRLRWAEFAVPDGTMIELFQYLEPRGTPLQQRTCDPGAAHFCFEVSDIDGLVARCYTAGIATRSAGPVRIVQGDYVDWRCVYLSDPDGFTVELVERPI